MNARGIPASALHNVHRHYYITVDKVATNWKAYVLNEINKLRYAGIVHVMDYNTLEEIERLHA